ncbi:MAG: response regulator transcription factor [Oscillospiraceae bacterium]|nr:response regulator transcription factor [Oscillospiraceae bacterium]
MLVTDDDLNVKKILVVEDDANIIEIIKFKLEQEGYDVETANDGAEGLREALNSAPDIVLLDVMLPKMSGFDVCRKIREKSSVPIIMLTARDEEVDKVLGLELGADDYMTKPFSMRELIARIKANLRRTVIEPDQGKDEEVVILSGDLKINVARYEVNKNGKNVEVTVREFELLKFLATQPDKMFSREMLLENVWGYEYYGDVRTVDVTVRRLREKIEDDPSNPKHIVTKRGVGYYFNK